MERNGESKQKETKVKEEEEEEEQSESSGPGRVKRQEVSWLMRPRSCFC